MNQGPRATSRVAALRNDALWPGSLQKCDGHSTGFLAPRSVEGPERAEILGAQFDIYILIQLFQFLICSCTHTDHKGLQQAEKHLEIVSNRGIGIRSHRPVDD